MMRPVILILVVALGVLGISSLFIVSETEYAIKFQLGRIVKSDYEPGIHVKLPFVNNIRKYDRRLLTLDTNAEQMLTSEQKFVAVDSFVKWRITDVRRFYTATQGNELVANVYYPGLADHPRHDVAAKQMRDFGAMVSFDLKEDTMEAATDVMKNTHYFTLAESLGGVESLIGHPASMTHASIPREQRLSVGLTDSLIRLSVGVEDADDLVKDLEQALAAAVAVA